LLEEPIFATTMWRITVINSASSFHVLYIEGQDQAIFPGPAAAATALQPFGVLISFVTVS
jgi:hypothetical protein